MFDVGVTNFLAKRSIITEGSSEFGKAFEHFITLEMRAYLGYARKKEDLCYWRSTSQIEVDMVVGDLAAIEVKASKLVQDRQLKGLRALREEGIIDRFIVVSLDPMRRRTEDGIDILPWREFLSELWNGDII